MSSDAQPDVRTIPLGLACYGIALFLLAARIGGWLPDANAVVAWGLMTGGVGLLLSGYWAFRLSNFFAGMAHTLFGTFFASAALHRWFFSATLKNETVDVSWISFAWAVVVGLAAITSFRARIPVQGSITIILFFLFFFFRWIGTAFHVDVMIQAAGVAGMASAILAWIGAFAILQRTLPQR